jgi:hypothetical protein
VKAATFDSRTETIWSFLFPLLHLETLDNLDNDSLAPARHRCYAFENIFAKKTAKKLAFLGHIIANF